MLISSGLTDDDKNQGCIVVLFAINEEGEFCWWWESDIRNNESTVTFGVKNANGLPSSMHGYVFGPKHGKAVRRATLEALRSRRQVSLLEKGKKL